MKKKQQIQRNKKQKQVVKKLKAFTLVETLVSVFLFSLLMVMISGTFSSFFRNYQSVKKLQKNLENAQYAVNLMSKTLRTSGVKTNVGFPIDSFDYSQGKCIRYAYDAVLDKLQVFYTDDGAVVDVSGCSFVAGHLSAPFDLTGGDIQAASADSLASGSGKIGRVSVALNVVEPGQTDAGTMIQTTVSLRQ